MHPRGVRMRYLKTYAAPDLLAALPWDAVLLLALPSGVGAYVMRVFRLVRLCKLPQTLQYISRCRAAMCAVNACQLNSGGRTCSQ